MKEEDAPAAGGDERGGSVSRLVKTPGSTLSSPRGRRTSRAHVLMGQKKEIRKERKRKQKRKRRWRERKDMFLFVPFF